MLESRLPIDSLDWILWGLQAVVLVLAWRGGQLREAAEVRGPTVERGLIAILLAWTWRLAYSFVLASSGFWYLVPDDVAKWLLSWGWAVSPYLITWDGIWQGGTFYLHGAAMSALGDPLIASKFVSAFYGLLPLVGIFVLTQAIYRNRRLSSIAVLAAAPWWLHILLATGTMTEMPVTGLMLSGIGLMLIALDAKTEERAAGAAILGAATCFLAATTFHLVAWMMLVSFLLVSGRRLLATPGSAVRRRLPLFLGVSFAYCVAWTIGCWIRFGSPLSFLAAYDANNVKAISPQTLAVSASAYPLAFLYDAWLILPSLAAGIIAAVSTPRERHWRERAVIGGAAATLGVLIASAIIGSPSNVLPVRSLVAVVASLFPIAVAALAGAWPAGPPAWRTSRSRLSIIAVAALAAAWIVVNHERTFARARSQETMDPDAVAMGAWLREAFALPDDFDRFGPGNVVHVWVAMSSAYPDYSIAYLFGSPRKTRNHASAETAEQVFSSVAPGQWLVTDRPGPPAGFEKVVTIGKYQLWRARPRARKDPSVP